MQAPTQTHYTAVLISRITDAVQPAREYETHTAADALAVTAAYNANLGQPLTAWATRIRPHMTPDAFSNLLADTHGAHIALPEPVLILRTAHPLNR